MSRYKVLRLQYWMETVDFEDFDRDMLSRYPEIPPVFQRDGYYFDRKEKVCWFEVEGKAYKVLEGPRMMLYVLKTFDYEWLPRHIEKSYREVYLKTTNKTVRKFLGKMLSDHDDIVEKRTFALSSFKWWKEIEAKRALEK